MALRKVTVACASILFTWVALLGIGLFLNRDFTAEQAVFPEAPLPWPLDWIERNFQELVESGFSLSDLLMPGFWAAFFGMFLAALGAIGGVAELYDRVMPKGSHRFSSGRRNSIVIAAASLTAAYILTSLSVMRQSQQRYLLARYYALEVHLTRFEGLLFNSLAVSARQDVVTTLFVYLLGYFQRIETIIKEIEYFDEPAQEFSDKFNELRLQLSELHESGFKEGTITDFFLGEVNGDERLLGALRSLEFLQEYVRRKSRNLER